MAIGIAGKFEAGNTALGAVTGIAIGIDLGIAIGIAGNFEAGNTAIGIATRMAGNFEAGNAAIDWGCHRDSHRDSW